MVVSSTPIQGSQLFFENDCFRRVVLCCFAFLLCCCCPASLEVIVHVHLHVHVVIIELPTCIVLINRRPHPLHTSMLVYVCKLKALNCFVHVYMCDPSLQEKKDNV